MSQGKTHAYETRNIYSCLLVSIATVTLATVLSLPLREMFDHSRGLLLFVAILFNAWYGGMKSGIFASVLTAISFTIFFNDQHGVRFDVYGFVRLLVYCGASMFVSYLMAQRNRALSAALTANEELEEAIEEIQVLRGLLPICMHCKQIRDEGGHWQQVESYIAARTDARFSHSVCPDCMSRHYPDVLSARANSAGS